jgi:hypothetical protein
MDVRDSIAAITQHHHRNTDTTTTTTAPAAKTANTSDNNTSENDSHNITPWRRRPQSLPAGSDAAKHNKGK